VTFGNLQDLHEEDFEQQLGLASQGKVELSNKSLASRSRHRLRALWNGVEDRSSRRIIDIDAGPGVGVLLGPMLLLALT
jgi:hypothetical protein